ncbi:hypothetical protein L3V83_09135 [Thiotrichales bacterium 19X7-9]|nr:hypothetical protein [Thiotrichales bacterium 19X7-9]
MMISINKVLKAIVRFLYGSCGYALVMDRSFNDEDLFGNYGIVIQGDSVRGVEK